MTTETVSSAYNPITSLENSVRADLAKADLTLKEMRIGLDKSHIIVTYYDKGKLMAISFRSLHELQAWSQSHVPHFADCRCVSCVPIIRGESETVNARAKVTKPKPRPTTKNKSKPKVSTNSNFTHPWDYPPLERSLSRRLKSLRFRLTGKFA